MGFLSPKTPPLPPVQAAPEPPSSELSDAEKAQIKKDRDAVERRRKGRRSTILTGPLGIQDDKEDATNTLLGKK
tara:strand:+ start:54 stop:275 length:222 start_codon:yes stop_codon:yes gene_type:complete